MSETEAVRTLIAKTVKETLIQLGIDQGDPLEMQRDFQYLRTARVTSKAAYRKGMMLAVGIVGTGALTFLWNSILKAIGG